MNILTVTIAPRQSVSRRALVAFADRRQGVQISFRSMELLWKVLGPERWDLLEAMTGKGPMTVPRIARAVGRDVKAVQGDIRALLKAGVVERTPDKRIIFPYDAVHVDFMLRAA